MYEVNSEIFETGTDDMRRKKNILLGNVNLCSDDNFWQQLKFSSRRIIFERRENGVEVRSIQL